jgi:hypothetical protein
VDCRRGSLSRRREELARLSFEDKVGLATEHGFDVTARE